MTGVQTCALPICVTSFDILDGQAGKYIGKDKKWHHGSYLFTVDFAHPESNIIEDRKSVV